MGSLALPAINERIRELRSALGLSQKKFSSIISISSGYTAGIETGRIVANDRIIKLICSSFNVSEAWLRYGEGAIFLNEMPEDKRFKNLVSLVRGLPPKYQDFLFSVLDMLIKLKDK
jgi:transcriptional regulator with XRE-family HTH domain